MLSEEEQAAIEAEIADYPDPRAACVEAMKIVQRHRGWVPDDAMEALAQRLGMSVGTLDSVATFYNLIFRKPVGRHVILLCDSASCWIMDYPALLERFREVHGIRFGETTEDGRFTLLPSPCLGACEGAPALTVDDDLHRNVTPENLDAILARYR